MINLVGEPGLNLPVGERGGPAQPLISVRGLLKHFPVKGSGFLKPKKVVHAVDGVDFDILKGETLGVVGESGCGKSTTARLLMQLIMPDRGTSCSMVKASATLCP